MGADRGIVSCFFPRLDRDIAGRGGPERMGGRKRPFPYREEEMSSPERDFVKM